MTIFFDHENDRTPVAQSGPIKSSRVHRRLWQKLSPARRLTLYPRSLTQLISASMLAMVLMLVTALVIAGVYLEKATSKGQQAVIYSTEAVQHSLMLSELLKDMERSARIYQVLGNESLLANYAQLRQKLQDTAGNLKALEFNNSVEQSIDTLLKKEKLAFHILATEGPGTEQAGKTVEVYAELRDIAAELIAHNSQTIETRVKEMKETAATTRQVLFLEGTITLALVLFVAIWVIPPLSRYVRDLDRSILQIGNGNLDNTIELKGPRDIRELGARLEWLRSQLQLLESRKQRFLQHFSHELKTPLASLREGTSLLSEGIAGTLNNEQREIAGILQRNCVNLQQQIDDLLNYSISMQPFQSFDQQEFRLDEQILGVTREHQLQIRAKELSVDTTLDAVTIYADTGQITTVLDNLISNAVKFSPPGGRIEIKLYTNDTNVVVDVADEGPGIPSSERTRIFEAFYQSPSSMQYNKEGSGLGLSLAKQYSNAHGGDIEVIDSNSGAHLRLMLPRQERPS